MKFRVFLGFHKTGFSFSSTGNQRRDGSSRPADGRRQQCRRLSTEESHPCWMGCGCRVRGVCPPIANPRIFLLPRWHIPARGCALDAPARDARQTDEGQLTLPLIYVPCIPRHRRLGTDAVQIGVCWRRPRSARRSFLGQAYVKQMRGSCGAVLSMPRPGMHDK